MRSDEIAQQLLGNSKMPASRQLLAVPFTGKDTPSLTSEFAHPDIIIGLTILAYRYDGLRYSDFLNVLTEQLRLLAGSFGPVYDRPAALDFATWVAAAGGRVRGTLRRQRMEDQNRSATRRVDAHEYFVSDYDNVNNVKASYSHSSYCRKINDADPTPLDHGLTDVELATAKCLSMNVSSCWSEKNDVLVTLPAVPEGMAPGVTSSSTAAVKLSDGAGITYPRPPYVEEYGGLETSPEMDVMLFQRVWPLELISVSGENKEQLQLLYRLLWREPLVIKALLFNVIFPLTMQHCAQQFSASGQELGSSVLFPVRLGFSGTPNSLLPLELGKTVFEPGIDGKICYLLTNPNVVTVEILQDNWNIDNLLCKRIARLD